MGEVVGFRPSMRLIESPPVKELVPTPTDELALGLTPHVVEGLSELGLPSEFIAITAQHVKDLHIVISPKGDNRESRLSVHNGGQEYKRVVIVNPKELGIKAKGINDALNECGLVQDKSTIDRLGLFLLFFEQTADAIGNSVFMQHKYNRYIPDFDGQKAINLTQTTVSEEFLKWYAGDYPTIKSDSIVDHADFRAGIAVALLEDELLRIGVVERKAQARWVSNSLAKKYPYYSSRGLSTMPNPLSREELATRLQSIEVKDPLHGLARYLLETPETNE